MQRSAPCLQSISYLHTVAEWTSGGDSCKSLPKKRLAHSSNILQPNCNTLLPRVYYFSSLLPPVIAVGDYNAYHQCWEPELPHHHTNTSGTAQFQSLSDSPHLIMLTPPGLPTIFHPHTGAASVLDLFIGNLLFKSTVFSTGPYVESDHLPVTALFPQITPKPNPECMPRWRKTHSGWQKYQQALRDSPSPPSLPVEDAAQLVTYTMEKAGKTTFHPTTHHTLHCSGEPWWNEECTQAVKA